MATYPIKMLKDEKGQAFVPYTSVKGLVDYVPGTDTSIDLIKYYYNKEEIDAKINSMFLICNEEEFATMTEADIKKYYLVVVETMAELTEESTVALLNVLKDETEVVEVDISENEAEEITDEIIGGTE